MATTTELNIEKIEGRECDMLLGAKCLDIIDHKYRNIVLHVYRDCDASSPREWNDAIVMCGSRRCDYKVEETWDSVEELEEELKKDKKNWYYIEEFDLGQGRNTDVIFYTTKERLQKFTDKKYRTKAKFYEDAKNVVNGDYKVTRNYIEGNVFGFNLDWEEQEFNGNNPVFENGYPKWKSMNDSCWGHIYDSLDEFLADLHECNNAPVELIPFIKQVCKDSSLYKNY